MSTAQLILRGITLGISYCDLLKLEVGELSDLLAEKRNDDYDWPLDGTVDDLIRMM